MPPGLTRQRPQTPAEQQAAEQLANARAKDAKIERLKNRFIETWLRTHRLRQVTQAAREAMAEEAWRGHYARYVIAEANRNRSPLMAAFNPGPNFRPDWTPGHFVRQQIQLLRNQGHNLDFTMHGYYRHYGQRPTTGTVTQPEAP